jgi:hypothetical protein
MLNDVLKRLTSLGYESGETDFWVLGFVIDKITNEIKNVCNTADIPEGLHHVAVDMTCGEFLKMKKGTGTLNGFDVEAAVKSISEGDTSVTYAIADTSITLDGFIESLIGGGRHQFAAHRRIQW